MSIIKKYYWKIIEKSTKKEYEYLFRHTYKGLDNYHIEQFKEKHY